MPSEVEERLSKARSGLARASELLADKYGVWSPETGTRFSDPQAAYADEGIGLAQELLAEIAALRAKGREDGAREMRERAAECARYRGERASLALQGGLDGSLRNQAVRDTARALHAEIKALPLTTRTEDGNA